MNEDRITHPINPYRTGTSTGRAGSFRQLVDRGDRAGRIESILDVDPPTAWRTFSDLVLSGRGVLISPTGDGGAVSLLVYDGNDRLRTYCSDRGEFEQALSAIQALTAGSMGAAVPSPSRRVKPHVERS